MSENDREIPEKIKHMNGEDFCRIMCLSPSGLTGIINRKHLPKDSETLVSYADIDKDLPFWVDYIRREPTAHATLAFQSRITYLEDVFERNTEKQFKEIPPMDEWEEEEFVRTYKPKNPLISRLFNSSKKKEEKGKMSLTDKEELEAFRMREKANKILRGAGHDV